MQRIVWAVHANAVDQALSALRSRQQSVPNIFSVLWQLESGELSLAGGIEQTDLDTRRAARIHSEIHAITGQRCAEGLRRTSHHRCISEIGLSIHRCDGDASSST